MPGIYQRICNYASDIQWDREDPDFSSLSFSDLCTHLEFVELREYAGGERWSDAGSREKLALRFYLAKAIIEKTPSKIPKLYLTFASQLRTGDIIISFNWDCLLEAAIEHVGKRYTYTHDEDRIKIWKPHGSLNWRLGEAIHLGKKINTLDWKAIGFNEGGLIEIDLYSSIHLNSSDTWARYQPLGELQPFIVLPGYGKAFDVRSIASLWYKPEFTFAACRDIYIIGLGLSQDDHFIRSFFLNNYPMNDRHTFVINPDSAAKENYAFMLRDSKVVLLNECFSSEHINLMTEGLKT
jgi:hypothetical protein